MLRHNNTDTEIIEQITILAPHYNRTKSGNNQRTAATQQITRNAASVVTHHKQITILNQYTSTRT